MNMEMQLDPSMFTELGERPRYKASWEIKKFADNAAFERGEAFETKRFDGNLSLNEGLYLLETLLIGGAGTNFGNANANLGVGDGNPTTLAGTLTFTSASAAIAGSGTAFTTGLGQTALTGTNTWTNASPNVVGSGTSYTTGMGQVALAGTTTWTNGSQTVTGSGTTFTVLQTGQLLVGPDGNFYMVVAIGSTTSLTIAKPYAGGTLAGQTTQSLLAIPYLIGPDGNFYQILTITDNTHLVLSSNLVSGGAGGLTTSWVNFIPYLIGPDLNVYKVLTIASNTSLTLASNYAGGTLAGQTTIWIPSEVASQFGLQASANKAYGVMSATFPQQSNQTLTWQAVFGSAAANFAWREFTIANGGADTNQNLNRKVSIQGVKVVGQTWTLQLTYTLA